MKMKKKKNYAAPLVKVVSFAIEQGFQSSPQKWGPIETRTWGNETQSWFTAGNEDNHTIENRSFSSNFGWEN